MTWKEFEFDEDKVHNRLPWLLLEAPSVLSCKDGSYIGVLEYETIKNSSFTLDFPEFVEGWSIISEKQHTPEFDRNLLVITWNPIKNNTGKIYNALSRRYKVPVENFEDAIKYFQSCLNKITPCRLLEGQEIFDFLSFQLSIGTQENTPMPDIPLFMDVLLTQDLDIVFKPNGINIGNKTLAVYTLPDTSSQEDLNILETGIRKLNYRHERRLLLFSNTQAAKEQERLLNEWCKGRKSIKELITKDLLGQINGYYRDAFIFLLDEDRKEFIESFFEKLLNTLEIPYLNESYNLKDIWWGSLAGMFRCDINPPIVGFNSICDILQQEPDKEYKEEAQ